MTTTTQPAELPDLKTAANAAITARDRYGWSSEVDAALNVLRAVLYTQPAALPALSDERVAFLEALEGYSAGSYLIPGWDVKRIRAALAATGAQAQADQAPAEAHGGDDIERWREVIHKAALTVSSFGAYFLGSSRRLGENPEMREHYVKWHQEARDAVNALMDLRDEMGDSA